MVPHEFILMDRMGTPLLKHSGERDAPRQRYITVSEDFN